jgi:hypothetical protein
MKLVWAGYSLPPFGNESATSFSTRVGGMKHGGDHGNQHTGIKSVNHALDTSEYATRVGVMHVATVDNVNSSLHSVRAWA